MFRTTFIYTNLRPYILPYSIYKKTDHQQFRYDDYINWQYIVFQKDFSI